MSRSRSIEIYLKPGVDEDDQIYAVWSALRGRGRPQDVFRRVLRAGLRAMAETGELPRAAVEQLDLDFLVPSPPTRAMLQAAAASSRAKAERRDEPQERRPAPPPQARQPAAEQPRPAKPVAEQPKAPTAPAPPPPVQPQAPAAPPASVTAAPQAAAQTPGNDKPRLGRLM